MFQLTGKYNEATGIHEMSFVGELPEKYKEQFGLFTEIYDMCHIQPNPLESPQLLPKTDRVCRFCHKKFPEVKFNKKAHILPELLGRSNFVSDIECDTCNQLFSKYETDLSYFIGAARTFSFKKGKDGIPKFKSPDKKLIIKDSSTEVDKNKVAIETYELNNEHCEIDHNKKQLTLKSVRHTYVPLKVFKAILKIAMTIMPEEEMPNYDYILKALQDVEDVENRLTNMPLCRILIYVNPGPEFEPRCILFKRKQDNADVIKHCFVIYFQSYIYQIFLPYYADDVKLYDGREITLLSFPPLVDKDWAKRYGYAELHTVMSSGNTPLKNQSQTLTFNFDKVTYNPDFGKEF